ncbi:MAG: hypothetical protein IIX35_02765, partial [Paraprevotella sp.]|nr:hypothetical protein [Paraprevotella sp.]
MILRQYRELAVYSQFFIFPAMYLNNYIQLDKTVWRIMRITSTGEMVLITEGYEANSLPWDDRYN